MDPISIAFSLAQFAPSVIKWITGNDKAAEAAEQVVDIAKRVTGKDSGEAAVEAIKADPALVYQFREFVIRNEADMDAKYLEDRQDARQRDVEFLKAGTRNWRADALAALAVIGVVLLTLVVWKDPTINEYVKGTFTLVIGRFLGYIDQIYQFEFGSTRSNKTKDETISRLTR